MLDRHDAKSTLYCSGDWCVQVDTPVEERAAEHAITGNNELSMRISLVHELLVLAMRPTATSRTQ